MTNELSTDDCLKELFRNIYRIHALTNHLTKQSATLSETSVNAAIAAGHTGTQSKVFNEIAKQIGVNSTLLLGSIERIHKFTDPMTAQSLESLIKSGHREKFFQVLPQISEGTNQKFVREVSRSLSASISDLLERSQENLAYARLEQVRIKQVIKRVWSISVNLRISASMAEIGEQTFFTSIAEGLEKIAIGTAELVENLTIVIVTVESSLTDRCQCIKGELHAA